MKSVYLIEDNALLRDFIHNFINSQEQLQIIGSCADGREGLEACLSLKPDIVILDVRLPSLNGIEVTQRLKAKLKTASIFLLSNTFSTPLIKQALIAKADCIIEKSEGLKEMTKGIEALLENKTHYSPTILEKMPDLLSQKSNSTIESLTTREREILQLIAEGYTTKEIAQKLVVSVKTADTHRNNLMHKLNVHNVAGLMKVAIANELIALESLLST